MKATAVVVLLACMVGGAWTMFPGKKAVADADYVPGLPPPLQPLYDEHPPQLISADDVHGDWLASWGEGMDFPVKFTSGGEFILGVKTAKDLRYRLEHTADGLLVHFRDLTGLRTCQPEQEGTYEVHMNADCSELRFVLVSDPCWRRSKARPRMRFYKEDGSTCKSSDPQKALGPVVLFASLMIIVASMFVYCWQKTKKNKTD